MALQGNQRQHLTQHRWIAI